MLSPEMGARQARITGVLLCLRLLSGHECFVFIIWLSLATTQIDLLVSIPYSTHTSRSWPTHALFVTIMRISNELSHYFVTVQDPFLCFFLASSCLRVQWYSRYGMFWLYFNVSVRGSILTLTSLLLDPSAAVRSRKSPQDLMPSKISVSRFLNC